MLATTAPLLARLAIFLLAGIAAGVSNGIAGGGTFIAFPTLLAMGVPALQSNVSVTVGVVPSFIGGVRGFRRELATHRRLVTTLVPVCMLGTGAGCVLLFALPSSTFRLVVPWLIAVGTLVFAFAPVITKRLTSIEHNHPGRRRALYVGVFAISIYGGYFGAGLGILLLAILAVTLPYEVADLQGLRIALSIVISATAAVIFVIRGHLALDAVYMLAVGTLIGGWLGTLLLRRLSSNVVRALVVATGAITTVRLFVNY
ncbi:MAG: sulfite exporter TauE/SafE family protein [Acidimicrobiaceae bacterium]|nr:sulfite exporter TauE/SafE family protein [Acidimicrobiaceae bacterium]